MPTTAGGAARPRQRWVMWTIPAMLFLVGFFHRAAPGVMARDLVQSFVVGRFLVGLGAAPTSIGTPKVTAAWFPPTRFGFLAALSATVGMLGALLPRCLWPRWSPRSAGVVRWEPWVS